MFYDFPEIPLERFVAARPPIEQRNLAGLSAARVIASNAIMPGGLSAARPATRLLFTLNRVTVSVGRVPLRCAGTRWFTLDPSFPPRAAPSDNSIMIRLIVEINTGSRGGADARAYTRVSRRVRSLRSRTCTHTRTHTQQTRATEPDSSRRRLNTTRQ